MSPGVQNKAASWSRRPCDRIRITRRCGWPWRWRFLANWPR